jgi:hypothetical protein
MKNGRTLYPDSAKIELLVKANPGRRGTTAQGARQAGDCCLSTSGPILADRAGPVCAPEPALLRLAACVAERQRDQLFGLVGEQPNGPALRAHFDLCIIRLKRG